MSLTKSTAQVNCMLPDCFCKSKSCSLINSYGPSTEEWRQQLRQRYPKYEFKQKRLALCSCHFATEDLKRSRKLVLNDVEEQLKQVRIQTRYYETQVKLLTEELASVNQLLRRYFNDDQILKMKDPNKMVCWSAETLTKGVEILTIVKRNPIYEQLVKYLVLPSVRSVSKFLAEIRDLPTLDAEETSDNENERPTKRLKPDDDSCSLGASHSESQPSPMTSFITDFVDQESTSGIPATQYMGQRTVSPLVRPEGNPSLQTSKAAPRKSTGIPVTKAVQSGTSGLTRESTNEPQKPIITIPRVQIAPRVHIFKKDSTNSTSGAVAKLENKANPIVKISTSAILSSSANRTMQRILVKSTALPEAGQAEGPSCQIPNSFITAALKRSHWEVNKTLRILYGTETVQVLLVPYDRLLHSTLPQWRKKRPKTQSVDQAVVKPSSQITEAAGHVIHSFPASGSQGVNRIQGTRSSALVSSESGQVTGSLASSTSHKILDTSSASSRTCKAYQVNASKSRKLAMYVYSLTKSSENSSSLASNSQTGPSFRKEVNHRSYSRKQTIQVSPEVKDSPTSKQESVRSPDPESVNLYDSSNDQSDSNCSASTFRNVQTPPLDLLPVRTSPPTSPDRYIDL
ncbi:hypothetical protein HDE_11037 [Halotydeus destructor]|nr:hypothetical protein HDE_11037 [Halotydeus destructor]